jgi:hypothetical protein
MMLKKGLIVLLLLFCGFFVNAQTKSSVTIKVVERYSDTPLPKVALTLYKGKQKIASGSTDIKGNYCFKELDLGTYRIVSKFKGYSTAEMEDIVIGKPMIITGKMEIMPCVKAEH